MGQAAPPRPATAYQTGINGAVKQLYDELPPGQSALEMLK